MLATAVACRKCWWTSVFEMLGCNGGNGLADGTAKRNSALARGQAMQGLRPKAASARPAQGDSHRLFLSLLPARLALGLGVKGSSAPSVGQPSTEP
jgi:hypothetical protein